MWILIAFTVVAPLPVQSGVGEYNGFTYIDTGVGGVLGYQIIGYTGPGGAVTIPETINGLPVLRIGHQAFQYKASITSVAIPQYVRLIDDQSFYKCTSLVSVTLPSGASDIRNSAFLVCDNLISFTVYATPNSGCSSVGGVLFNSDQTTLLFWPAGKGGSYTIPASVTSIRDFAFSHAKLTSVTIPGSVSWIGYDALSGCPNLTAVTFQGNAPSTGGGGIDTSKQSVFCYSNPSLTIYYLSGTTGWSSATFPDYPTVMLTCAYTLNPTSATLNAAGGTGSFAVTSTGGCNWSATADQSWLHTSSSGGGSGTVSYTVDANPGTTSRTGTISVGGKTFTVTQPGLVCSYALSATVANCSARTGSGSFTVLVNGGCSWTAFPNTAWLHTTSSGSGNGAVNFTVDANASASPRTGIITVGGQTFTVNQASPPPVITQQPVSQVVATGATAYFTVGVTGSGIFFRWYKDGAVLANNAHISGADGATLVISGAQSADAGYYQAQIYNASGWTNSAVVSLGVCYNVFSPASAMFAAAGGSGSVSNACGGSIVASASVYWLHITSGGSGGVSRAITYTVDANTSASTRTGTITVSGQSFTVTQAGVPPVITRQPTNQVVVVGAAAYFSAGATGPSLAWQWQKDGANLTDGGHYTGVNASALVIQNVQPGDAGHYSVWVGNAAGWVKSSNATLTVCAYSVSAANAGFGPSGGTNSVTVSHNCGYSYSANNSAPWVHILSGAAGATPGTLVYRVDANPAATARSAVLAISGQPHTVFQAGTNTWTIYWQHTDGTLAAWYMDGTNLALNGAMLLTPSQIDPTWQLMAAADLNRDSRPELLWQHQAGALGLWYLNGTALASAGTLTPGKMGREWKIVATPDLNGDGKAEVLWQSDLGWLGLWFMDGATMTNASYLTPNKVDPNWRMAGALDLNGDHRPEILWRHKAGAVGSWFLSGLTATNFVTLTPGQVAPSWQIVGAGNRKSDGKPMILWQSDSGDIGVWYLNGTTMESFSWLNPSKVAPAWRIKGMVQP
jgi:hypothetical protein